MGHPVGLFVLFFTEMWERFSYYGMRSLLVLYMVNFLFIKPDVGQQVLGFNAVKGSLEMLFGPLANQPLSSQLYGFYTAFVYLTPLLGGMLADKVLGQRRSVILGGVLMAIGEFTLMSPRLFFPGLILLIIGNGAFKPNISTQVGGLYKEGDPRRDGAFTIFYMGINLGAFLAPLVCGTLGQSTLGWHWGFGAAGVGMILGLILYLWGQPMLAPEPAVRESSSGKAIGLVLLYIVGIGLGLIVLVLGLPWLLGALGVPQMFASLSAVVRGLVITGIVGVCLTALTFWITRLPREERLPVGALLLLCILNIVFWACYEQQGNTMQLWADQNTRWPRLPLLGTLPAFDLFGWHLKAFSIGGFVPPSSWFQAFNPLMIFAFAPLLNMVWAMQAKGKNEPSSVTKMAIGCFLLGLSYIVMVVGAQGMGITDKRSVMWLVSTTFVITIGELYLSPIGLSLVTKVAPQRMVSMMMGAWFLSSFFGNYLSGALGTLWDKWNQSQMHLLMFDFSGKQIFFLMLTALGLGNGLLMMMANRPLNRVLGAHDRPSDSTA